MYLVIQMNENNKKCYEIIGKLNLNPTVAEHEPILNYETADKVDKELGWDGCESKTLFLKGKSGKFYLYITLATSRMDSKLLKRNVGEKVNMVSGDEMIELTNMQPGCMTPFGFDHSLISAVVIDPLIFKEKELICAFGSETMSMQITPNDLETIIKDCYDNIVYLSEETE